MNPKHHTKTSELCQFSEDSEIRKLAEIRREIRAEIRDSHLFLSFSFSILSRAADGQGPQTAPEAALELGQKAIACQRPAAMG